jgi:hypothetical protein
MTDVILWLYSQSKKDKPLPPGCQAIMAYVFINGWESDFCFSGVDGSAKQLLNPPLQASVPPEAFAAGQVLLKQYGDERMRSIRQYEADGLPPFMRPQDWLGAPSGSGRD